VKRILLALGIVACILMLQWYYDETMTGTPTPLHFLWGQDQATPAQGSPATTRETISTAEMYAMMQDMASLRVAIADYFMTNETLPRNFDEAQITAPPHSRLLQNGSVEYLAGGRPTARVLWRLRPTSMRLEWDCISPDIANISQRSGNCRYVPSFKPDDPIQMGYTYNHRLLFEFDRSSAEGLSEGERKAFQQFLAQATLKPAYHPQAVQITGYADPMGDARRNIELAEGRAAYAREAAAAQGIDRSSINVRVIGADPKPLRNCPADLPREERIECFGLSRRVDITISGQRDL
jgi:outer membrane protein OmpA-like peptidoglycan-associated protein